MFCQKCGNQLDASAKFCGKCGSPVGQSASNAVVDQQNQSSSSVIPTPPVQSGTSFHTASRLVRFAHYLIDTLVVGMTAAILIFIITIVITMSGVTRSEAFEASLQLLTLPLMFGYYLWMESKWKFTIGKLVTGYKVVMRDGSEPNFRHILGRTFARIIPFEAFSVLIGKVGWHDTLSKTLVVPKEYTPEQVQQIQPEVHSTGKTVAIIIAVVFVLIIIVGLLASVVLLALGSARVKSRDAKRVADAQIIASSLEFYYDQNKKYPTNLSQLAPKYLASVPVAPTPHDGECSEVDNRYNYSYISANNYALSFCLGQATGVMKAGKNKITPQDLFKQPPLD